MKKLLSPKVATKLFLDFCPDFFVASWGLPRSFFGLPVGFLINDISYQVPRKPQKASRKPPGGYKKFQGRNPYNILVAILVETMTPKRHFEIN